MNNEIKIAKPTIDELDDVVKSCVLKLDEKEMYYFLATIALYKKEEKEIKRLNNIINKLEKELNKDYDTYVCKNKQYGKLYQAGANTYREHILYKLQELKGDSSNE